MADNPLSHKTYGIARVFKFGGLTLTFTDGEGTQILSSKGRIAVTQQPITSMDGKTLATITHKILAMTPEYQIHEGGPKDKVLGVVKVPMQFIGSLGGLNKVEIKDESGALLATVSGNFLDMEFNIVDAQGNAVATVSRKMQGSAGLVGKLAAFARESYVMNITDNSKVTTLTLLGFLVVLELLLSRGQASNPGLLGGIAGGLGGGGLGGFGGGGRGIGF